MATSTLFAAGAAHEIQAQVQQPVFFKDVVRLENRRSLTFVRRLMPSKSDFVNHLHKSMAFSSLEKECAPARSMDVSCVRFIRALWARCASHAIGSFVLAQDYESWVLITKFSKIVCDPFFTIIADLRLNN